VIAQGRKTGGTLGDPQSDTVAIADEDVSRIACATRNRKDLKRLPKERMGRIGYFSAVTAGIIRVVERGIKEGFRSIT
jgi:hypothetical protein